MWERGGFIHNIHGRTSTGHEHRAAILTLRAPRKCARYTVEDILDEENLMT